ncbi:MAG: SRPBCC family protein, partial [Sphingomonadales bacterium]
MCRMLGYVGEPVLLDELLIRPDNSLIHQTVNARMLAEERGIEIVEFDPPSDMAWTAITGIEHRGRWRLRRNDERTVVELRVIYHAPGRVVAPLVELVAAPIVHGHLARSLAALKQQVEALPRSIVASPPRPAAS